MTPPLTHLRYFELDRRRAAGLETELRAAYPDRDILVYPDDWNVAIRQALADLRPVRQGAAFAFLDPDGQQLHFDTVRAIAQPLAIDYGTYGIKNPEPDAAVAHDGRTGYGLSLDQVEEWLQGVGRDEGSSGSDHRAVRH